MLTLFSMPATMGMDANSQPTGTPGGMSKDFPPQTGALRTAATISEAQTFINNANSSIAGNLDDGDHVECTWADANGIGQLIPKERPLSAGGRVVFRPPASKLNNLPTYVSNYLTADKNSRVTTAHEADLVRVSSSVVNEPCIKTVGKANGYWFTGFKLFPSSSSVSINDAGFAIRSNGATLANYPTRIAFERGVIRGDATTYNNLMRGIVCEGVEILVAHTTITKIQNISGGGTDPNGLAAVNGPWKLLAFNNHIDAAGEGVIWGGWLLGITDPFQFVSSDIALIRNYIAPFAGYPNTQRKNLWEAKQCRRQFKWGNVLGEYVIGGQTRAAVLTPTNQPETTGPGQPGVNPWVEIVDDIEIASLYENIAGGTWNFSVSGSTADENQGMRRVQRLHCAWRNVTPGGNSTFTLGGGTAFPQWRTFDDLNFDHCELDHNVATLQFGSGNALNQMLRFIFTNNVHKRGSTYGRVFSEFYSVNIPALNGHCGAGNYDFRYNLGVTPSGGSWGATLIASPYFNAEAAATDIFQDPVNLPGVIKAGSIYENRTTDGVNNPGVNHAYLNAATAGVKP